MLAPEPLAHLVAQHAREPGAQVLGSGLSLQRDQERRLRQVRRDLGIAHQGARESLDPARVRQELVKRGRQALFHARPPGWTSRVRPRGICGEIAAQSRPDVRWTDHQRNCWGSHSALALVSSRNRLPHAALTMKRIALASLVLLAALLGAFWLLRDDAGSQDR